MSGISQSEVEEAKTALKNAQNSFPSTGSFQKSADVLMAITDILKECWNTTGGVKEQEKLKQLINSDFNYQKIEHSIEEVKNKEITVSTVEKSKILIS